MGFKAELDLYTRLHTQRYEVYQKAETDNVVLQTGSINQGHIIAWKPSMMIPHDLVARALKNRKHPIRSTTPFWKFWQWEKLKIIKKKFAQDIPLYCHRFDLMDLTRSLSPLFTGAQEKYAKKWNSFIRPNGPVYVEVKRVQEFISQLFKEMGGRLDRPQRVLQQLGPFYFDLRHVGWEETFAEHVKNSCVRYEEHEFVITKEGIEATREIGISRLVAALSLTDYTLFGICKKTAEGGVRYLLPYTRLHDRFDIKSSKEIEAAQGMGLLHALIHAQDAKWCNVALIKDGDGEGKLISYDMGKSLLPAKTTEGYHGGIDDMKITLCTAMMDVFARCFDCSIPPSVLAPFADKNFSEFFHKPVLEKILEPTDPLRKDPELLKKAEERLQERAEKLRMLILMQKSVSLQDVFDALYPDEMLFVEAAKKLDMFSYDAIFPNEILGAAMEEKELFPREEWCALYDARDRLKADMMPVSQYFPLWREPLE